MAIIAFILSLLSKSMAVTLPFILLLLDYLIKRKPGKVMFIDKIPFFCLSLMSCFIVVFGLIIIGGVRLEPHYGLFSTLATASYGITFYLTKTLFPLNLSCLYPYNNFEYNPVYLYSIITVIILFIVVFVSLRYTKKLLFGAAFFLITLLPVLQFIPNSSIIVADRYTYIPSIGIFFIFSTLIYWVYSKISKQGIIKAILVIILTCIIGILSILTYNRCKVWYDGITLWSDVLKKYPNFVTALNNRGNLFAMNNEHDSALIDFKKAVSIKSEYKESRNAYLSLANLYRQTGEIDEAIIVLQEALNKSPNDAEIFYNLGIVYSFMNKGTAVAYYKKAIKLNPLHTATYYNLGSLYIELGDREGAITMLKKAIKINPDFTIAYAQLAKLYNNPARTEELVYLYKEAIRRNLDFFDAYYYIGNLYQESGRDREAMVLYKRALQIDPKR